ncbi:MAG TPA: MoaD/ThiS family protein [Bacteroidia bacterium]|nr:MoaD/ThiS family protein [Bacteroidia bacterium]
MEVNILAFGQIADITAKREWQIHDVRNTIEIRKKLEEEFPLLRSMSYMIAVNKKIISEDVQLEEHSTVALLPPFSGG